MTERTKKIRINVTQKDIRSGVPANAAYCPVALAIRRRLPAGSEVRVYPHVGISIYWPDGSQWRMQTPEKVARFINTFDGYKLNSEARPITFELEVLEDAIIS